MVGADSNRVLHDFLAMDYYYLYNRKIMKACGLTSLPDDRRTFDRRLKTISPDIKERIIAAMAALFVKENFVDPYIVTIDSTLLKAKSQLWNKKIRRLPNMLLYRTHNSGRGTYCPSHVKNDEV
jgi:hypothetical protein